MCVEALVARVIRMHICFRKRVSFDLETNTEHVVYLIIHLVNSLRYSVSGRVSVPLPDRVVCAEHHYINASSEVISTSVRFEACHSRGNEQFASAA